ncbi:MAG TPA: HPF/RaiA family ribosome-associated protein [Candidatus Paceibacterota bacterium]|nr:HPF/RaiA family ribosome-associated protein [Candidatus Paceibacterota bacterium]
MNIDIVTKNITLDKALDFFVRDKLGLLQKLLPLETSVRVEIGKPSKHHRSGPVFYAEANLKLGGKLLRAEATHVDLRAAIVDVKDALKIEIQKFKGRQNTRSRRNPLKAS